MRRAMVLSAVVAGGLALSAAPQAGRQSVPKDAVATWLRNASANTRRYLVRTAEKMPEDAYTMRPGPQMEVRTFGQIIGHLANYNFLWCSQAKGEPNPSRNTDFEKVAAKADLVKAVSDAVAYCDGVYAALTDASGLEMVSITQENGQTRSILRTGLLIQNHAHNNEHYGNLVTYMRIKSIVPPSSEPRTP